MSEITGRCATCKYAKEMEPPYFYGGVNSPHDLKQLKKHERFPLSCLRADMSDGYPDHPQTMCFSMDASSYHASLMVTPDFGCVMYEEGACVDDEDDDE